MPIKKTNPNPSSPSTKAKPTRATTPTKHTPNRKTRNKTKLATPPIALSSVAQKEWERFLNLYPKFPPEHHLKLALYTQAVERSQDAHAAIETMRLQQPSSNGVALITKSGITKTPALQAAEEAEEYAMTKLAELTALATGKPPPSPYTELPTWRPPK